jgi:hypothetical protein
MRIFHAVLATAISTCAFSCGTPLMVYATASADTAEGARAAAQEESAARVDHPSDQRSPGTPIGQEPARADVPQPGLPDAIRRVEVEFVRTHPWYRINERTGALELVAGKLSL